MNKTFNFQVLIWGLTNSLPLARGKKAKERRTTALCIPRCQWARRPRRGSSSEDNKILFNKIHSKRFSRYFFHFITTIKFSKSHSTTCLSPRVRNLFKSNFTRPIGCHVLAVNCSKCLFPNSWGGQQRQTQGRNSVSFRPNLTSGNKFFHQGYSIYNN